MEDSFSALYYVKTLPASLLCHLAHVFFHISVKVVFMPFRLKPGGGRGNGEGRKVLTWLVSSVNGFLALPFFSVDPRENSRCLWILHFSFFPHRQMDGFPNWPFAAPSAMPKHLATPSAQVLFLFQMALVKIPVASRLAVSHEWHESGPQEIHFIAHSLLISQLLNITVSSHLNLLVGIRYWFSPASCAWRILDYMRIPADHSFILESFSVPSLHTNICPHNPVSPSVTLCTLSLFYFAWWMDSLVLFRYFFWHLLCIFISQWKHSQGTSHLHKQCLCQSHGHDSVSGIMLRGVHVATMATAIHQLPESSFTLYIVFVASPCKLSVHFTTVACLSLAHSR